MEHLRPQFRFVQHLDRRTAIVLSYPTIHMCRLFKLALRPYINCTGSVLPPTGLKRWMIHLWPQSRFVQLEYRRTGIVHRYPTIHTHRPFEIGCTSVHQLYRIRITTKRIETVNETFLTSIPIRTNSIQAYNLSSHLSHNTYVQTILNWLYVRTPTVHVANGSQIDQISVWDFYHLISKSCSRCTDLQTWLHPLPYKINGPKHN